MTAGADVIPIRPPLPDPHPAALPAIDAITRLMEQPTFTEHDRGVLELALYAVRTAYPDAPRRRQSTLPRDESHDPSDGKDRPYDPRD